MKPPVNNTKYNEEVRLVIMTKTVETYGIRAKISYRMLQSIVLAKKQPAKVSEAVCCALLPFKII